MKGKCVNLYIVSTIKCLGSEVVLSPENNKAGFWGRKDSRCWGRAKTQQPWSLPA